MIGLAMQFIFRKKALEPVKANIILLDDKSRLLWQNALSFAVLVGILVFTNWARPDVAAGAWFILYTLKWWLTGVLGLGLAAILIG
ncbi:hypothetical protein [Leptodesmis sp.]|uniref:hypothetical protein n=1 Tax=Leptodesmis sp. TaxID=3100501 RepID=UPI0040535545